MSDFFTYLDSVFFFFFLGFLIKSGIVFFDWLRNKISRRKKGGSPDDL